MSYKIKCNMSYGETCDPTKNDVFCTPGLIHIILAVAGIVEIYISTIPADEKRTQISILLVVEILLALLIHHFCKNGKIRRAWAVVILPLIIDIVLIPQAIK